jgi:hypothetical protein
MTRLSVRRSFAPCSWYSPSFVLSDMARLIRMLADGRMTSSSASKAYGPRLRWALPSRVWAGHGGIWHQLPGNHIHSIVQLDAPGADPDDDRALRFLTTLADRVGCDFGLIHRFDHAEAHRATGNGTMTGAGRGKPLFMVTSHDLKRGIPDIYWMTLFGRRYVDMFGRERLRTAPAAKAELLPDGSALLQASLRSGDVVAPGGSFAAVRQRIIEHLGRDAFYDPRRPDARTVTPAFDDTIARSLWSMDPVAVELRRQAGIE